jgi:ABC-2 type transport system permease protein
MISARIKKFQAVMPIVQLVLTPMMFLSGSLFPLAGLPAWLAVLTEINPLTYAVEPMRHVVFERLAMPPAVLNQLDPGITWGAWVVPIWLDVLIVARRSSSGGPTS